METGNCNFQETAAFKQETVMLISRCTLKKLMSDQLLTSLQEGVFVRLNT
jgi:hypothetical protein